MSVAQFADFKREKGQFERARKLTLLWSMHCSVYYPVADWPLPAIASRLEPATISGA